jgi:glucokinase-like ROK family protein
MPRQFRTGDQTFVRELNRSILLERLWVGSSLSRADLAVSTGLNKTTVSSLIDGLISDGFVREIGLNASAGGRPGVLLELNPDAGLIIGAEIGVERLNVVVSNLRASISWRRQIQFDLSDSLEHVLEQLVTLLRQARQHTQRRGLRLFGAGVTIPGLVDVGSGTLVFEPNMGWTNVAVRQLLVDRLRFPILIDNDANAAALAERYFGVARGVDDFAYVVANIGLGTGLVLGGHILQGVSGHAGEAGHTTIDPDGPLCRCGNRGCWERLASQRALMERAEQAIAAGRPTLLTSTTDHGAARVNMQTVLLAARAGDAVALEALHETGVYLGIGIANLVNIFNPSLVALGGTLSLADEFLLPVARQVVQERAMRELHQAARIVVSAFKADACVMGGVALVLHGLLSRPQLVLSRPGRPVVERAAAEFAPALVEEAGTRS